MRKSRYCIREFYLSDKKNLCAALQLTNLAADELEQIVGRFRPHSSRAGKLRGKVLEFEDCIEIRTSFGNKLLWRSYE
jgi:hypothetical protein